MNGNQIVISVIGVAFTIAAPVMFKAWLASRQQEKESNNQVQLSQQETERLKIFADAVKVDPALQTPDEI